MDRVILQIELAIAEDIATDPSASTAQRACARRDIRNLRAKLARLRLKSRPIAGGCQAAFPAQLPKSHM